MFSKKFIFSLILLIGVFCKFQILAQVKPLAQNAKISVITCGLADPSYAMFGHTALRINDPEQGLDLVFNFGTFDFDTPNFVLKFAKGDLLYYASVAYFADFKYQYTLENRAVYEQVLQLTLAQKQHIFDALQKMLASNDKYYMYKFIDNNCTTKIVSLLEDVLGKNVLVLENPEKQTYREVLYPYFDNHFPEKLGTSIIFGSKVDQEAKTIFLPLDLKNALSKTVFNGKPLVQETNTILPEAPQTSSSFPIWTIYLGLMALLIVFYKSVFARIIIIIFGFLGILFAVLGLYSFHPELANNYNVLLFNPLFLLLLLDKSAKRIKIYTYLILASLLVFLAIVCTKTYFVWTLPILAFYARFLFEKIKLFRSKQNL